MSQYFGRYDTSSASQHQQVNGKPCKACSAFKDWAKTQGKDAPGNDIDDQDKAEDCPLDKEELGRSTWGFLHTMAAYYPDKPSDAEQQDMKRFFKIFAKFYPCQVCADHLKEELKTSPPKTESSIQLSSWLCQMHNKVNVRLGKPAFDCTRVFERWRDGWKDGSCD